MRACRPAGRRCISRRVRGGAFRAVRAGPATPVRFGVFELDRASGELRRAGLRVRLQPQASKLLLALLERPGEVVSRDQLRGVLWGRDTYVAFDHCLNSCVNQLRHALRDSAASPRFVETVPRVGYRFIAPMMPVPRAVDQATAPASGDRARWTRGLAALIVTWLAAQGGAGSLPVRAPVSEPSPAVREAYLKGLYHAARGSAEWPEAALWLEQAARRDPAYGPAQTALARTYVQLAEARLRVPREVLPLARSASAAALVADGLAAEPHLWAGLAALYGEWDWDTAGRELRVALILDPRLAAAHRGHAAYLSARGDDAGAVAAIERARQLDPLCPILSGEAAWYRYCARQYDDAATLCAQRSLGVLKTLRDPAFDGLRADARFQRLLRRVGVLSRS